MFGQHLQELLLIRLDGMCDAAGDLVLTSNPMKGGEVLVVEIVSCVAETAGTDVAIEFVKGPLVYGLKTLDLTAAGWWYKTRGPVRVPSDWSVRLTFSNGGNVKYCRASVYGYLVCRE